MQMERILAAGEKVYLSIAAAGEELTYQGQYLNDGSETWKDSGLTSDAVI